MPYSMMHAIIQHPIKNPEQGTSTPIENLDLIMSQVSFPMNCEYSVYALIISLFATVLFSQQIPDGMKVSVVSVVGAFRTGKSFLLNFFLRYLRHSGDLSNQSEDWMTADGNAACFSDTLLALRRLCCSKCISMIF